MKHQFFFGISVALIVGVACNHFFGIYHDNFPFLNGLLLVFMMICYFVQKWRSFFIPFLLFQFFIVGVVLNHKNQHQNPFKEGLPKNTHFDFVLSKTLNSSEKNARYLVEVHNAKRTFKALLLIPKSGLRLDYQHVYSSSVYIIPFVTNPKSTSLQSFDYSAYLAREGIFIMAYTKPENVTSKPNTNMSWSTFIKQRRHEVLGKINLTKMSANSQEFLKSIILADRTQMDKGIILQFNKTGLVHLLAISGSHIIVIFWMLQFVLGFFLPKNKWPNILLSLGFIVFFSAFIGFGNSVVRSCLMLIFYYISVMFQRQPNTLHSLSLAAILIILVDANQIFDLGFQLSFLAVLGIYWLYTPIKMHLWQSRQWFLGLMRNTLALSLAAQLATFPLIVFLFGNYSVLSLVYNLVMVPITQILIVFSFIECSLIGWGINIRSIDIVYDFASSYYLKMVNYMSSTDVLYFENIQITLINMLFLYVLVYMLRKLMLNFNLKNQLYFAQIVLIFLLFSLIERQFFI